MKTMPVHFPEMALVAATRALGGIGVGLLLSEKLRRSRRRQVGGWLVGLGVATTVPLVWHLLKKPDVSGAARNA